MTVMLTNAFSIADPEVQEFLNHRPNPQTSTWFEHCYSNGYSVEEMMGGYERWKRQRSTIEHESACPRMALNR